MINQNPLVSAVIPTRNRAVMLRRALRSVAVQQYSPLEVIVVDDGSTDGTQDVADSFSDKLNLHYIKNEESAGAPRARNVGIKAAAGEFVAGLDDDDEWHPERITQLMAAWDESYACVTSNVRFQYKNGSAVWHKKETIDLHTLLFSNQVGNQILTKKERLLAVGGFDEQLAAAQDYDLWIRLCLGFGPIKNVQHVLQTVHTEHEENRITNSAAQLKGYLAFYKKHKHLMDNHQRKYQLFNIRRAQGKVDGLSEIAGWVPTRYYAKEVKRLIAERLLND